MKCTDKELRCFWEKEETTEKACIPIEEKVNNEKNEKKKSANIFKDIKKENKKLKSCEQIEEPIITIIEQERFHPQKVHIINPDIQQSFCASNKKQISQISIKRIDPSENSALKEEQEDIEKNEKKCTVKKRRKIPVKVIEEDCTPKIEEEVVTGLEVGIKSPIDDILITPKTKGLRKNPQFHNLVKEMQTKLPQLFREDMQLLKVGRACCYENPCIRDDETDFWKWLFGQNPFELGIRKLLDTAKKHLDNTVLGELINRVQHPEEYMINEKGEIVKSQTGKRKQKTGRSFQVEISQDTPQKIKSRNSCNVSRTTISVHFDSCDEDDEDEECNESQNEDSDTNENLEEKNSRSRTSLKLTVNDNFDCPTDYAEEKKMDYNDSIKRRQKIILQQQAALLKQQLCLQQGGHMSEEDFERNLEMQCKALEQQVALRKQLCGSTNHQPQPSSQRNTNERKMKDSMQMKIEVENGKNCVVKTPAVSMKRRISTSGRYEELQFSPQQQIEKNRQRLKQFQEENGINSNYLEESVSRQRCEEHYNAITDLITKLRNRDI